MRRFMKIMPVLLCCAMACCQADADSESREIFEGVVLTEIVKTEPGPLACFVVAIDPEAPGIRFTATGDNGEAPRETTPQTTRDFVAARGAQIGINANFFTNDHKPHADLLGLAVSEGAIVSPWDNTSARFALNISRDNAPAIIERKGDGENGYRSAPAVPLYTAVSGTERLLRQGEILPKPGGKRHPRTAAGITAEKHLLFMVVDGRQAGYSTGMTFRELAQAMKEQGAVEAIALDGGGSSTLVIADPEPRVVNVCMPFESASEKVVKAPGYERANGNNLAVFARPPEKEPAAKGKNTPALRSDSTGM
jgi:exopolysaccharide biosynthesis protein